MSEYRVPELNVQNGVLKALAFMFEYIGEMGKDYIYAITPMLEDALMDRDLVHRQTAATTVKHIALGVQVRIARVCNAGACSESGGTINTELSLTFVAYENRAWVARTL
jgi:hypothetical protein